FEDTNRNGLREAGEQGVPGVTVVVKDSENKILSAVTDASGSYTFLAVRETPLTMTYTIPESQTLRFNIPKSTAANGSKVTPGTDGLSATYGFTATGKTETVNAAVSGFVTIGYDKNNAAATGDLPTTDECPSGSTVTVSVKPDNLLYKGYVFKEWNTAPDGKGTGYQPGQTLTVTDSMTLYAIWEIGTYTLRFDYRGATGGNTTTEKHLIHNQSYDTGGALPAPTRPGYSFKGWAVNAATTTVIAGSTLFTLGEDSTLYAVWTAKSGYTVKYNTNGTAIADRSVTWVEGVLPTDAPTRAGYTFDGWYYKGNKVTVAATYGVLAGAETPSITLDAGWTAKTGYTVHYNSTGGTTVADKTDVAWSDSGLLPQNNPTRANFAFGGWKLTNTETAVTSATTYSELAFSDQITAITLDAVWNMLANNTVSYDTGGGTVYTDKTNVLPTDSGLIPTADPVRAGYEFIGWMSGANTVTAATVYSSLTTNTTLTLNANWKAKSYTISYSEGGFASVAKGWNDSGLIGGKTPIKAGSTFDGWYYGNTKLTDTTKVSGLIPQDNTTAITLTAKWNEDSYTIAYQSNGGGSFPPKTGVKYSATNLLPDSAPVRLGYSFTGWKCGETAVTADTTCGSLASTAVGGVITLSASWTAKTGYIVRYNSTGGTLVPEKTGVAWTQTALTPAVNPSRDGYEFKAWVSGRTTVTATTAYGTIAADDAAGSSVTLVAQWNEVAGYTVSFDTGAGTPVGDKTNLTSNSNNLLPTHDIAPAGFKLTGWTFKGMTVTQATTYGELAAIAGGDPVVLTAVYAPIPDTGGNGTDVQGKVIEGIFGTYKLDVSWGAMKFDYNSAGAVWNPDTHSYTSGSGAKGWTSESFEAGNNKITVANHSNGDVLLSYLAKLEAALSGATMTVRSTNSLAGTEAANILLKKVPTETAAAPTVDTFVWLTGDPTNLSGLNSNSYTKAGVITITATPDMTSGLTPKKTTP
ncbi:MAG: InlB B-repeat-containing protein, partial [Oscillospiraceae bacterium]